MIDREISISILVFILDNFQKKLMKKVFKILGTRTRVQYLITRAITSTNYLSLRGYKSILYNCSFAPTNLLRVLSIHILPIFKTKELNIISAKQNYGKILLLLLQHNLFSSFLRGTALFAINPF